ncbi:MAG: hypothetical protein N2440_02555 [Actinobacteria bacterium]|nr:hypothetical protein [Actinomycetota bacterium]
MGIYFNYDYEEGKEVENWVPCYLCGEKKVLYVEYHIKKGPIYTLLNDEARKLWSGREIKIVSDTYLICDDCYQQRPSEDLIISEILKKKRLSSQPQKAEIDTIKVIENEIEDVKGKITVLMERLGELYERLGREKVLKQKKMLQNKEE